MRCRPRHSPPVPRCPHGREHRPAARSRLFRSSQKISGAQDAGRYAGVLCVHGSAECRPGRAAGSGKPSTVSVSRTDTCAPSAPPAVLAANTANTSAQEGGPPWISTRSEGDTAAWTEKVLTITVTPRTPDDMRVFYAFTGGEHSEHICPGRWAALDLHPVIGPTGLEAGQPVRILAVDLGDHRSGGSGRKTTERTARQTIKTAERSSRKVIKTTQRTAKTAQQTVKTAQRSAQATVKATQRAVQTARATAKAAAVTTPPW